MAIEIKNIITLRVISISPAFSFYITDILSV